MKAIQETGQKNSGDGAAAAAAAAASLGSTSYSAATGSTAAASSQASAPSDDLLGLFDNVQSSSSKSVNANGASGTRSSGNGSSSRAAGGSSSGASTAAKSAAQDRHRQVTPTRRPSPPLPPPYDTAIQSSSPTRPALPARPPPYHEALAAQQSGPLLAIDGTGEEEDKAPGAGAQSGTGELVDLGEDFSRQVSVGSAGSAVAGEMNHPGHAPPATTVTAGEEWWAPSAAVKPQSEAAAATAAGSSARVTNPAGMGPLSAGGAGSGAHLSDLGRSKNGSISCTRSTSLAEYGAGLPGVLRAAKGGGVLSSNPRLLCVCNDNTPEADGAERSGAQQESAGHVSVLDLWHRGRTVRYPVAADRAAMSPNQSESVVAVLGGGSLHVFSIPRRCRLQEQAVATDLCMWR